MKLYSSQTINDIRNRYDFNFAKSLGQNFLIDLNIINQIVDGSTIGENDLVIEIGPGIGVITQVALERGAKVIAIEIDQRLIPILEETLAEYDKFEVINADVLKIDLKEVIEAHPGYDNVRIIGNLPYYITTPIIMKILEEEVPAKSITVMMQKEVADRIKAPAGTRDSGPISYAVQFYSDVKQIAKAPKEAFMPSPKIDSVVLRFDILDEPVAHVPDRKLFFECIKNGFGKRRKTISNSLAGTGGTSKEDIKKVLEKAGLDPSRRAETLTIEEFAKVATVISEGDF